MILGCDLFFILFFFYTYKKKSKEEGGGRPLVPPSASFSPAQRRGGDQPFTLKRAWILFNSKMTDWGATELLLLPMRGRLRRDLPLLLLLGLLIGDLSSSKGEFGRLSICMARVRVRARARASMHGRDQNIRRSESGEVDHSCSRFCGLCVCACVCVCVCVCVRVRVCVRYRELRMCALLWIWRVCVFLCVRARDTECKRENKSAPIRTHTHTHTGAWCVRCACACAWETVCRVRCPTWTQHHIWETVQASSSK